MIRMFHILILIPVWTACLGPVHDLYPGDEQLRPLPVYLVSISWHTGIVIESDHIAEALPRHCRLPQTKYLKFGWGDNRYYPHTDPGFGLLLRAALLPTGSVLHVVGIDISPENYPFANDIIRVMVSEEGMEKLVRFIAERFRKNENGELLYSNEGLYDNSAFFKAKGRYYLPKTSNVWAARALRSTGAPITPAYALTVRNTIYQASRFGEVIR